MADQELPSINDVAAKFMGAESVSEAPKVEATTELTKEPSQVVPEETKAPEAPKREPMAAKFAALARREKEARTLREQAEQRVKDLDAREKATQEKESRLKGAKRPLEALKELGFTYAQATEEALGNYKEPEVDPVDAKISDRLSSYDERLKKVEEAEARVRDQLAQIEQHKIQSAVNEVNHQIKQTVASGDFELVAAHGQEAIDTVREIMTQYYQNTKKTLTYEEACDRLEKYYVSYAEKLAATNKIKTKFSLNSEPTPKPRTTEVKEPSPTLTNAHSSASKATPDPEKMSDDELMTHLAKKLRYI